MKKFTAIGLASLLTISGSATFAGAASVETVKVELVKPDELIRRDRSDQETAVVPTELKEHDKVRVIVELEGDAASSYSIEKGVKYKDLPEAKKVVLQTEIKVEQKEFLTDVKEEEINF
ncbi:hypothetical protein [Neobacillus bataviensis]|uniref:hypothetical protein n=1 Tax=Neobacillus bataviensis TaxID=220685 RepID=UPI001CBFC0E3|nr:hypothetical protein [Neobacillus bataviensis]